MNTDRKHIFPVSVHGKKWYIGASEIDTLTYVLHRIKTTEI